MAAGAHFLESERLAFRWWSERDLPLARELWGDPEVTRFFGGPLSDAEIARRLEVELERASAHNFQYWPIHLLDGGEFAGCCGLRPYRLDQGIPELGFHLRPEFWGRGLAPEAATAVIRYAFETLGAKGLSAGHHPENANSRKVLDRLGFRYTHQEFFPALGIDIPYYLLLRDELGRRYPEGAGWTGPGRRD